MSSEWKCAQGHATTPPVRHLHASGEVIEVRFCPACWYDAEEAGQMGQHAGESGVIVTTGIPQYPCARCGHAQMGHSPDYRDAWACLDWGCDCTSYKEGTK